MDGTTKNVIECYSRRIPDPVRRLRFQHACLHREQAEGDSSRGPLGRRIQMLEIISGTEPFSQRRLRLRHRLLLRVSKKAPFLLHSFPHARVLNLLTAGALSATVLTLVGLGVSLQSAPRNTRGDTHLQGTPEDLTAPIWRVETDDGSELYSNGLMISNRYLTRTAPRKYPVFDSGDPQWQTARWGSAPVGIVFHTTESELADFVPSNNREILRRGHYLAQFVGREHLYNFLVDRFGRVHRIVPESEYAFHSGNSIWSDEQGLYLGLNHSFLGVALETTRSDGGDSPADKGVTAAQLRGARLLTQWLRHEYQIPARNCVTHEMVSVNPGNMLIGYHTDWSGQFPFEVVGLPNNYNETLPSIALWGFSYDELFVAKIDGRVWPGIKEAEKYFRRKAAGRGAEKVYRRKLTKHYRRLLDQVREELASIHARRLNLARGRRSRRGTGASTPASLVKSTTRPMGSAPAVSRFGSKHRQSPRRYRDFLTLRSPPRGN